MQLLMQSYAILCTISIGNSLLLKTSMRQGLGPSRDTHLVQLPAQHVQPLAPHLTPADAVPAPCTELRTAKNRNTNQREEEFEKEQRFDWKIWK